MTEMILQAYHVLDEILSDPIYLEVKKLDHYISKHFEKEVLMLRSTKAIYDTIMSEGGSYHPDFKDAVRAYGEAKMNLYNQEEVKKYFELEKQFQDQINDFLAELTQTVSSHIKTPNKLGIIAKGGSCHVG
jgi:cell fate (sporulation/competence/biofilm development) regulator YlbF (YheA/YmcA/DUF963 family)